MNFLGNPAPADAEALKLLDDLRAFVKSEPWDFSFLDDPSTAESWEWLTVNNGQQNITDGQQNVNNWQQNVNNGQQDFNNWQQNINNGQQNISHGQQNFDVLRAPYDETTQALNYYDRSRQKSIYHGSEPWDFPFLDDGSTVAQSWEVPTINHHQQHVDGPRAPMRVPQLSKPTNRKRKRTTCLNPEPLDLSLQDGQIDPQSWEFLMMTNGQQNFDIPLADPEKTPQPRKASVLKRKRSTSGSPARKRPFIRNPGQSPAFKGAPVVIFDAKGHKKGARDMNNLHQFGVESDDGQKIQRSEADNERARKTLSILAGKIAILRYACGCKSPKGICNHHSFSGGLNLPDGVICPGCRNGGAAIRVSNTRSE
jgi:hypothetical protein